MPKVYILGEILFQLHESTLYYSKATQLFSAQNKRQAVFLAFGSKCEAIGIGTTKQIWNKFLTAQFFIIIKFLGVSLEMQTPNDLTNLAPKSL